MDLSPEVLASIVSTAGKWSLNIAASAHPAEKPRPIEALQSGEITRDLETHFNWAFSYLEKYMQDYYSRIQH
jgi:hypothetical protein